MKFGAVAESTDDDEVEAASGMVSVEFSRGTVYGDGGGVV